MPKAYRSQRNKQRIAAAQAKDDVIKKLSDEIKESSTDLKVNPEVINRLIASMNLDEMLEASKIVDMKLREEKATTVKARTIEKIKQDLTFKIVEQNKKTTNEEEAWRLYRALMEDES